MLKKNLVLLGMMAVGKTTLGHIVAKKQEMQFIDIDKVIEKKNLMKISDIFKKKGEKFFRAEEEIESIKALTKKNCVISLGGGAFINKNIRDLVLKKSISIWLDVNIDIINSRTRLNKKRPLLDRKNNIKKIEDLYNKRKHIYKLADHRILCDRLTKKYIVHEIINFYEKQ